MRNHKYYQLDSIGVCIFEPSPSHHKEAKGTLKKQQRRGKGAHFPYYSHTLGSF